tara:strand:+ start:17090 stop:18139 length:1050 start_codon:yes stop_codon:yes gene_type:complete
VSLDLTTNFGGLVLRAPIIVGACPLTANIHNRIALEAAGVGAIVLPSLFEEHVIAWKARSGGTITDIQQRQLDHIDRLTRDTLVLDVETYLAMVNRSSVQSGVPVIASLNGGSDGDWLDFAGELDATGVSAIEVNLHHRTDGQGRDPRDLEDSVVDVVRRIRSSIRVPLFLKLHREYTSVSHLARRLVSGVQGLVLYARDPEIDIALDNFQLRSDWGLTPAGSISPMLRALMSVYGHCPAMPLTGSGGIAGPEDLIKVLLAGADAGAVVAAVYREGPDAIRSMLDGLRQFMTANWFSSLNELQSRRPMEFSTQQDRGFLVESRPPKIASPGDNQRELIVTADPRGHVMR